MLELSIKTLLAYLSGALMGGLLLGSLRGVDIRTQGSGNAGGTNAIRTQGLLFGLAVLGFDVLKGVVAVAWLPHWELPGIANDPQVSRAWLAAACAAAAVTGHVYPVWFDFRGGKGAATMAGAVGALAPWLLIPMLGTWTAVLILSGYVGLATMCAGLAAVGAVLWRAPNDPVLLCVAVAMAAFLIFTHRSNIERMRAGTESRAKRVWLLKPRA